MILSPKLRPRREILLLASALVLFLALDFLGAFEGLNRSLADFSFRLRGPQAGPRSAR